MKGKFIIPFLLCNFIYAQDYASKCKNLIYIDEIIQYNHYKPKPVNDSLSVFVFNSLSEAIDPNKNLMIEKEFHSLMKHIYKIDNYINNNNCEFLKDYSDLYESILLRKLNYLKSIRYTTLDYQTNDTLKFIKNKGDFLKTTENLHHIWHKKIKFDILEDISKSSKNLDSLKSNFKTLEHKSKTAILDKEVCKLEALLIPDNITKHIINSFYNAFTNYFDPHSDYFNNDAKSSFLGSLSPEKLSIGIDVIISDKEELIIEDIVPGGPGFVTNKFEKGDHIVSVSNTKDLVYEVNCNSLNSIYEMIFSDSNKTIELTVRKKNGNIVKGIIKKKNMKSRSTEVYSYVVGDSIKYGYIKIPSFYSEFKQKSSNGCAQDVAKQIVKLKKDNIKGLIIDLEDNGGGSMSEAINLTSYFLESGPISIIEGKFENQYTIYDKTKGQIYDGPIIVMVNNGVASASEFFTAAIQDYNRGIILGSKTLGKATMQSIYPVLNCKRNTEFVKVTIDQFFRITGYSHQAKGIIPDVITPTFFDEIAKGEADLNNFIPNTSINSNEDFKKYQFKKYPDAIQNSINRIAANQTYTNIKEINKKLIDNNNAYTKHVIVNLDDVFEFTHQLDTVWDQIKTITDTDYLTEIELNNYDKTKGLKDEYEESENEYRKKLIRNNPNILESIKILNDINSY